VTEPPLGEPPVAEPAPVHLDVPTPEAMRALGRDLAGVVRAGDLLLLTGDLGAGKTTLTRGLGSGLRVRGEVTSPTFVIARVHPPLGDGPALVHADAYRLGGLDELADLDLEASQAESVTVVEWGAGLAEGLSAERLEIELHRPHGEQVARETRAVVLRGVGERWRSVDLTALLRR
jgi:tRNA threonylcarbamoyladenosine biosynthesis protein TsaE